MYSQPTPAALLGKLIFLTVLGFVAVVVSGPVLAILSVFLSLAFVLLSFAFVGFLVWLPFHVLLVGRETAFQNLRGMGQAVGGAMAGLGRMSGGVLGFLPRLCYTLRDLLVAVLGFVLRLIGGTIRLALTTAVVALFGVFVGVAFGVVNGTTHGNLEVAVPMFGAIGGLIAAVVGAAMTLFERRPTWEPAQLSATMKGEPG
jgi:hypothetical protein